ncbi:hypothetical protein TNCV_4370021 [Trichonephila clavipes]|nr:hypothetical protein TNCV_4370021 [Trichonephila clavipes]
MMYAAFLSRRESIAGESPISFPKDTSIAYLEFEPDPHDYKPSVKIIILGGAVSVMNFKELKTEKLD